MDKQTLKPRIRFANFTDDWEQRKLGDISCSYSGGTPPVGRKDYYNGGIPFIRSGEISNDITELHISEKALQETSAKLVETGDILYALYGATSGEVSLARLKGAINQAILAIIPHATYNSNFIVEWLRKEKQNIISTYLQGGQGNLSGQIVKQLSISVTNPEEQIKIGTFFNQLDNLITLHQHKLEKLKNIKKACLEKMFPQKNSNTPKVRFKGFTDAWEQRKVREAYKVTRGNVLAATKLSANKSFENPYPVYSSQTKDNGLMGYYNQYLYHDAITWTTDGANAGTVRFRKGKFYCTNVCGVLLSDTGLANKMTAEALNRIAWKYVSKVGNPKLMNNVMADIEFVMPSINEQNKISALFENLDDLITLHQRKLEKLKNIKKACLEKMFV